ncbi:hypothetical protein NLG97_g8555 [Lecanicillium saksenae]|uniref:Uncharacterized protein n=1 Tax=Lecanicillium saksenae TaxID=468837 RepID=A0ACC1QKI9_9HYPO|nr:hypothetical protein NLG97_g8555 [Lecanicillium saksenae]
MAPQIVAASSASDNALHGNSVAVKGGITAMCSKDPRAHKSAVDDYFSYWEDSGAGANSEQARLDRKTSYAQVTNRYYDLVTDMVEHLFGKSFHFCRIRRSQPISLATVEHERYLASKLHLIEGQTVLDIGSGVGGPAREIARYAKVKVVGLNNNAYQILRAERYTAEESLTDQVSFTKGDFMSMPLPPASFDAAYSIEGTSYAPDLELVYKEIFKVLKPGGLFAVYEMVMTDEYNEDDPGHRQIRYDIEQGFGMANLATSSEASRALAAAGFELIESGDVGNLEDEIPWYYTVARWSSLAHLNSIRDLPRILHMSFLGSKLGLSLAWAAEKLRILPPGSYKFTLSLASVHAALASGGERGLFTPMFFMVGKKPVL